MNRSKISKKGFVYSIGIFIITLIVLSSAFIYYYEYNSFESLSERKAEIYTSYLDKRADLIKLDHFAKMTEIDSVYYLVNNSGFFRNGSCGTYYGTPLLSYKNSRDEYSYCFPNLYIELNKIFKFKFERKNHLFPSISYVYKSYVGENNNLKISGFALNPLLENIGSKTGSMNEKVILSYPSFTSKVNFNFSNLYGLNSFFEGLNENCRSWENNKRNNYLDQCVESYLSEFNSLRGTSIKLDSGDGVETAIQDLKSTSLFNFKSCYYDFRFKEGMSTDKMFVRFEYLPTDLYNISLARVKDGKYDLFGSSILNKNFYFASKENNLIVPLELNKYTYSYETSLNSMISLSGDVKKMNSLRLYSCDLVDNAFCFISDDLYNQNFDFFNNRICEFENRRYRFKFEGSELYPEKGNLTYRFGYYVEDLADPEFDNLVVRDKEFDEDTSLIIWNHSISNDVKKYEIFVDGVLVKTIVPWDMVSVFTDINWEAGDQDLFKSCNLAPDSNTNIQCYYDSKEGKILLQDNKTYFFKENNQFVYVLNYKLYNLKKSKHVIKVVSYDDDGNLFDMEYLTDYPIDTLPYKGIFDLNIVPILIGVDTSQTYSSVYYTDKTSIFRLGNNLFGKSLFADKVYNLDGSIPNVLPSKIRLYSGRKLTEGLDVISFLTPYAYVTNPITDLGIIYSAMEPVEFIALYEDSSLDNLDNIPTKLFGFTKKTFLIT